MLHMGAKTWLQNLTLRSTGRSSGHASITHPRGLRLFPPAGAGKVSVSNNIVEPAALFMIGGDTESAVANTEQGSRWLYRASRR